MARIKNGRTVPSDGLTANERIKRGQAERERWALQAVAEHNGRTSFRGINEMAHLNALTRLEKKGIILLNDDGCYEVVPGRVVRNEHGWYTAVEE